MAFSSFFRASAMRGPLLSGVLLLPLAIPGPLGARTVYEENGVFPGQKITNQVEIIDRTSGQTVARAKAVIRVSSIDSAGSLRVFEMALPEDGRPREQHRLTRTDHSMDGTLSGTLLAAEPPQDVSKLAGQLGAIDTPGTLDLVETEMVRKGAPIFFVLADRALNLRSDRIDTALITVTDATTGDREVLRLHETGRDSAEFTAWLNVRSGVARRGDGLMSSAGYSRIDASYIDTHNARNALRAGIMVGPVDPYGTVFDSATGDLINGIRVTLIDTETGRPARVFSEDVTSAYPSSVETGQAVTDSSGRRFEMEPGEFRFPYVYPGTYRIEIEAPEGYDAPSTVPDAQLEALAGGTFRITDASRLKAFEILPGTAPRIDIPLDRRAGGKVERVADRDLAEPGDIFEYAVSIDVAQTRRIDIVDNLPAGIRFLPGSMSIDGRKVHPEVSGDGLTLTVPGLAVRPGQDLDLRYAAQVRIGAAVADPHISTTVVTEAGTGRQRMSDDHVMRLREAFRMAEMPIVGQVVAGSCGAPPEKRDLSNIRILLETGDQVLTDSEGRFSFRGIDNRPRVIQMDPTTLPARSRPVLCTNTTRSAGSPISQFVDVREGMMARVEFHLEFDTAAEAADVLAVEPDFRPVDPMPEFDDDFAKTLDDAAEPRILTPVDGYLPYSETIDLAFTRPSGLKSKVFLNGVEVAASLAERASRSPTGKTILERYRSIRVREGRNLVSIRLETEDGEPVSEMSSEVLYATTVADMELVAAGSVLESDGRTTPVIRMRLVDEHGYPVRPGTIVTVAVDEPFRFLPEVRRSSEPGQARRPTATVTTVVREEGQIRLTLAPALETWRANFRIMTERGEISERVRISAAERPWVVVGIAEGTLAEASIREHLRRSGDMVGAMSGRLGLFAEGVVKGEWLLTLRIDTARGSDDPAFTGIDPEEDYVVYGDRSIQDDAAKSRFPLYLRLRKEGAEYLVGDFNTDISTSLVDLNRDVTGLRALFETEAYRVMAFAAETSQRYVEDRIALNGTLGPYQLTRGDIVDGSETVRLVEISRIDASREIGSRDLEPGLDYLLSSPGGRLFLREPIPAFSAAGNRHILVIGYETDEEIADGVLAGIRAEVQVSERLRLGATALSATRVDGTPTRISLAGADLSYAATGNLTLSAEAIEVRKTDSVSSRLGREAEIRAEFSDGIHTATAFAAATRGNTAIDASLDDRRSDRAGAEFSFRLVEGDPIRDEEGRRMPGEEGTQGLFLEGVVAAERDMVNRTSGQDSEIFLTRKGADLLRSVGLRHEERSSESERLRASYLAARTEWTTGDGMTTFGIGLESSVAAEGVAAHDRISLSAGHEFSERLTLEGSAEVLRERDGHLASGLIALDASYETGTSGRLSLGALEAFGAGRAGSALRFGLDQSIGLSERTELTFGLTAQRDLGAFDVPLGLGAGNPMIAETFSSATAGLRHTRERWSAGVDLEYLEDQAGRSTTLRLSADGAVSDAWSVGGDATLIDVGEGPDGRGTEVELRFAAAWRRGPRDPITLFQIEMERARLGEGISSEIYGSVYHTMYLGEADLLNLRGALKHVRLDGRSGSDSDLLTLAGIEWRHDLSETVDFGLHGSVMQSASTGDRLSSLGASIGVTTAGAGYLSVGYNIEGFAEEDFSQGGHTDQGAFIQFRMRLDQDSLKGIFR